MTACNAQPGPDHPMHGTMVACHMAEGHDGPHTWDHKPSLARMGVNKLLALMPTREIERIDSQLPHPIMAYDVDEHGNRAGEPYRQWDLPAGPWVLVQFVGGDEYAIWKRTGNVYRVGPDGAVEEDPMLTLDNTRPTDEERARWRRLLAPSDEPYPLTAPPNDET